MCKKKEQIQMYASHKQGRKIPKCKSGVERF